MVFSFCPLIFVYPIPLHFKGNGEDPLGEDPSLKQMGRILK
jgi:hypothetical protein